MSAKVLVVANRTAESPELLEALRRRADDGPCEFTLLVPSTPHGLAWAADMSAGGDEAEGHRQAFVDECNFAEYDELIVSTLPLKVSKWLRIDLPHKAGHATGLPVTHVVGSEATS